MLTITENGPDAQVAGSTLFYNPTAVHAGTFTVAATTTDAESGIAQVAFPTVFGSDGVSDTTAPYSTSYSWSAGASATGAKSVTATNGVGLTASSSFTVTPDSAGPSVAITAPAAGATVFNGVNLSANASDAISGVAQVEFWSCPGSSCDFATGTAIGTPDTSAPYGVTWSSQPTSGQYTLIARATDTVGNTTVSTPITVTVANDTTVPSAPVLTITETAPDAQVTGSTLFYNPAAGHAGTFTVAASTSDAESGIAQVAFPTVFGADGVSDTTAPYSTNYSWSAGATASGAKSVTATNGAGLTASSSFTVTPDSTGPSGLRAEHARRRGHDPERASGLRGSERCPLRSGAGGVPVLRWGELQLSAGTAIGAADTTAPYGVTWSNQPANGSYTLIARATDSVGNTTDSAPVTVTVNNATAGYHRAEYAGADDY